MLDLDLSSIPVMLISRL